MKTWCVPPDADGEFVWRMEDVIQTYMRPYDPRRPVVCFDEACKQLFGEVRTPQKPKPGTRKAGQRGKKARIDYEYERKGVCNQFMMCEPLGGWRHVKVTSQRTRQDYAECIRELVEEHSPDAELIRLVQDNLNTQSGGSLYETFAPEKARRLLDKIEFHYTPKHGSWVNMAETEIGIMNRQCLDRRISDALELGAEVSAWQAERNRTANQVHWQFTTADARELPREQVAA